MGHSGDFLRTKAVLTFLAFLFFCEKKIAGNFKVSFSSFYQPHQSENT